MDKPLSLISFTSIEVDDPSVKEKSIHTTITLKKKTGEKETFLLQWKYEQSVSPDAQPLLRLAALIPLLNYGLFAERFVFHFPLTKADMTLLQELLTVFSRDIFVNKILRRRTNYILPQYLPDETKVTQQDASPQALLVPSKIVQDTSLTDHVDPQRCGILSSGGKESLFTYGLLKEIGCDVYPFYVNESGGHWRTALPAYRYHQQTEPNTRRVWTNVDRFYTFMLDHLHFIRSDHRTVWADTYPIRLCIFPFYIFLLLPLFVQHKVGNLLMGNEFDDLRSTPEYHGIHHYYGVYDQHQDYDVVMNRWFSQRIPGMQQWSAVRWISGLIVERILVQRYPELAHYQRSCHSCHIENGEIIPCGTCSKCMGVLLFLLANKADPTIMKFQEKDIRSFHQRVKPSNLRLDQDEKEQSFYLIKQKDNAEISPVDHVEQLHICEATCDPSYVPEHLRKPLFDILEHYTKGYCQLQKEHWVPIEKRKLPILCC